MQHRRDGLTSECGQRGGEHLRRFGTHQGPAQQGREARPLRRPAGGTPVVEQAMPDQRHEQEHEQQDLPRGDDRQHRRTHVERCRPSRRSIFATSRPTLSGLGK